MMMPFSGGRAPLRQSDSLAPIDSMHSGENWKDRHSSPHT
jgi:hypothetical protein